MGVGIAARVRETEGLDSPLPFLSLPYTSHKLRDVSFKLVLKPKNSFSWPSHKEKTKTQHNAVQKS